MAASCHILLPGVDGMASGGRLARVGLTFDENLGKGASGAAVEAMNMHLAVEERHGAGMIGAVGTFPHPPTSQFLQGVHMKAKLLVALLLTVPFLAHAEFTGPRASSFADGGNRAVVNTVAAANMASDDTPVLLEGKITRQLTSERYKFADATGTIQVEIDEDYLPRENFDQTTPLRIKGKVDRRWGQRQRYIEVKSVEIIR
jgi:uncharacterized protein (TIGR00156 family)